MELSSDEFMSGRAVSSIFGWLGTRVVEEEVLL